MKKVSKGGMSKESSSKAVGRCGGRLGDSELRVFADKGSVEGGEET